MLLTLFHCRYAFLSSEVFEMLLFSWIVNKLSYSTSRHYLGSERYNYLIDDLSITQRLWSADQKERSLQRSMPSTPVAGLQSSLCLYGWAQPLDPLIHRVFNEPCDVIVPSANHRVHLPCTLRRSVTIVQWWELQRKRIFSLKRNERPFQSNWIIAYFQLLCNTIISEHFFACW